MGKSRYNSSQVSLAAAAWGSTRDQWHVQGNASRGQDRKEWPNGAGGTRQA